jgi:LptD protein
MKNNFHTNQFYFIFKALFLVLVLMANSVFAQDEFGSFDLDTIPPDFVKIDSILTIDTLQTDSVVIEAIISEDALESKMEYKATDSIRFDMQNQLVFLYGSAEVYYQDIELKAELVVIDMDSNLVTAKGKQDSLGNFYGEPVMKEAGKEFFAHEIKYNFETKKGLITEVITHEGESYIHGRKVYKTPENIMYIKNGKYTTCNLKHPHYFFSAARLKIIPDDKIVTGPANLYIEDAPTPLAIPFGFFPNSNKKKSGLIIPEPGESAQFGFFLLNGGYYLGISDNLSMRLTGDFYTKGSWGANFLSDYKKRYRFSGKVNARFSKFKNGIEESADFSERKDFFFRWNHQQDPRARPTSVFSANVNFGTSSNFTNNFNSSTSDYLSTSFNSSISYKKSWEGKPFNLSLNGFHTQNTLTKTITVKLPEVAFNVSRLYPFKKKLTVGKQSFYEKIGLSYSMNTKNEVTAGDSLFRVNDFDKLKKEFRNGMRHTIPISTSFKILKNFTVNPTFNYSEIWYLESINRTFNADSNRVETDTLNSFVRGNSYSTAVSLSTKIYGMYQYRGNFIKALRHVVTPSVGWSYTPENTSGLRSYSDTSGNEFEYSIFENGIYGSSNTAEASRLNFSLINNFEMKVRNRKDSLTQERKIKLLENLRFSSSYNMIADSLKWSNIVIGARTNIFKKITVNFSGTLDPYALDSNETTGAITKVNKSEYFRSGRLGRLTTANTAIGFSLRSKKGKKKEKTSEFGTVEELEYIKANPEEYIDFNIPWTLNVNYNIRYSKPQFQSTVIQTLNFSGDFSLTPKWKIGFNSGWDFEAKDLSYTSINFHRDLHCWEMTFNWIPIGPRQSYLFTIRVKSPILQDLKLTRRNIPNIF